MIIVRILQRKHFIFHFASNDENDSACTQHEQIEPKVRNSSSSMFAFSLHFGWQLKIDSSSTRYPFCLQFWFKVRKSFVCYKSISVFKFQKDAHFVFNSKMIQGPQGTHFPFAFESKFANHLFATKSIWVSNSRFKFQKVRILPSVLGQCYKDPQMVLKMTTTKRFDWNLQKISGFVIEMNHIKSDYSQKYPFRRRW